MADSTAIRACANCGQKNRVPAVAPGLPRCGKCHRWLPWITDATEATFAAVAEQAKPFVIVDLWATWCGPCRMVSPALEQVATDMAGRVKLVKVDVDSSPKLSERFQVQAVPTLLVLHDGQVIARQSGAAPAYIIRSWVEDAITKARGPQPTTPST